jgi:pyruvate,water dikinase
MREIFRITAEHLRRSEGGAGRTILRGTPVAPGRAVGRARVIAGPEALVTLHAGEILVCEATTPSWTPAFATIAGCVCNVGGSLTHAAIVSREYGVPCVTGTLRGTELIATGDLVEVDGGAGRVRVLKRRAASPHASR